ncbi:hypothetical protein [Criblamydia sequanensis]|uniref:Uncharacterized protein n=1 Tax=Candidatus Criblamydia sequanensis CRIB-18 TaxID=1437425 RepID=A0A090CZS5_9BACT|nr:hypothetical protein [Criblamydia sequanensis]CDR32990.1 hypothetical protein CSEC_0150 [Criblamydia sequanensis CRIB-18]
MDALRGWFASHYNKIPDSKEEEKPIIKKNASKPVYNKEKTPSQSFKSSKDKASDQAERLLNGKYF